MTNKQDMGEKSYKNFISRINHVSELCNIQYTDSTPAWKNSYNFIENYVKDKDVFEIGYGFFGGLSQFVIDKGARSYVGVDIDALSLKLSTEKYPDSNFIWDDPIYVMNHLDEFNLGDSTKQFICISSGVMDTHILKSPQYIVDLINAIRNVTPIGGYSIHSGTMLRNDFNKHFEKSNLLPMNNVFADCFEVYKRVK